jgi:hypothetical protein
VVVGGVWDCGEEREELSGVSSREDGVRWSGVCVYMHVPREGYGMVESVVG